MSGAELNPYDNITPDRTNLANDLQTAPVGQARRQIDFDDSRLVGTMFGS